MNMSKYTPFIRYGLIWLSGMIASRGWLGADDAHAFANDPAVIELAVGIVTGLVALVWYAYSTSRAALKRATE